MQVTQTIPMFRIFDVAKAKEFYLGFLGFGLDWEHHTDGRPPRYLQVSRGGLVLHLTEHHGDCCPGGACFTWMSGLDAFHAEVTSKGYPYNRPGIELAPWGARLVTVTDPFGNKILFNERAAG